MDDVLHRHAERELDDWQVAQLLRDMANRIGPRLFDDLVNRIGSTEGSYKDSLLWAVGIVGGGEALARLWQIVRTEYKSTAARRSALWAIERLGGLIDPTEIPEDLRGQSEGERSASLLGIMRAISAAPEPANVEDALMPLLAIYTLTPEAPRRMARILDQAAERQDRVGADCIRALVATAPSATTRSDGRLALAGLISRGVHPASQAVLDLPNEPEVMALAASRVDDPGKLELLLMARRVSGRVRAFRFLIDVASARGAVTDMSVTADLTEAAFREQFIQRSWLEGAPLRETSLEAARDLLRRAVDAIRSSQPGPRAEFERYLPLIQRYALGM